MDIYGHLYNEMQGEACRLIDELVSPVKVDLPTKMLQEASKGEMLKNPTAPNCTIKNKTAEKAVLIPQIWGVSATRL